MKHIVLLLGFISLVFSCKPKKTPLVFELKQIENNYDAEVSVAIHTAQGHQDIAEVVNTVVTQNILQMLPNSNYTSIDHALEGFNSEFVNYKAKTEDTTQWELALYTDILSQTDKYISVFIWCFSYAGGAHGNKVFRILNFDAKTGKPFKLLEKINENTKFIELAKTHFETATKGQNISVEDYFYGEPFQLPDYMGLNSKGVFFKYGAYEVITFIEDRPEFTIPFSELDQLMSLD